MTENKEDAVETAIEKLKPILAKTGFGAVMGFCSGMALKKVGKALAVIIGIGAIGLQTAVFTGYLAVDWSKISDDMKKKADTNDDGKLDQEDVKNYWKKFKALMTNKVPSAGGFGLGFLFGVRYG